MGSAIQPGRFSVAATELVWATRDHQGPEDRGDEGDRAAGRDVELAHDQDARDAARGDAEDRDLLAQIEEVLGRQEDALGQELEDEDGRQDSAEQAVELDVLEHRLWPGLPLEELDRSALGVGGGAIAGVAPFIRPQRRGAG